MASLAEMATGTLDPESDSIKEATRDLSADGANRAQQLAWAWHELPVPVIAAVSGIAFGGGLHIALGADIRFIAPTARLAFVEITWGLVPDLSATQSLRRLVPLDVAKKLILTGEEIDGVKAVALGLGTELSEHPVEDAMALARVIAERSPSAKSFRGLRALDSVWPIGGPSLLAGLPQEGTSGTGHRVPGIRLSSSTTIPTSAFGLLHQGIVKVRFSGFSCSLRKRCCLARFAVALSPANSTNKKITPSA